MKNDSIETIEIKSKEYKKLGILKIYCNKTEKLGIEKFIKNGQINLEMAVDVQVLMEMLKNQLLYIINAEKLQMIMKKLLSLVEIF